PRFRTADIAALMRPLRQLRTNASPCLTGLLRRMRRYWLFRGYVRAPDRGCKMRSVSRLSAGATEEIRTPDPQIRSLVQHWARPRCPIDSRRRLARHGTKR